MGMKTVCKNYYKKDEPRANLQRQKDRLVGDLIALNDGCDLPKILRGQTYEVKAIQSYQFEHRLTTSFVLQGSSGTVFLSVAEEDGETLLNFSIEVERDVVGQLFDLDQFADIFDSEDPVELSPIKVPETFEHWLATEYKQTAKGQRAYFYEDDYRKKAVPAFEGEGEPIDYYCLESADRNALIEIEVYGDGYTEVCVVIVRPGHDIRELWPGKLWSN